MGIRKSISQWTNIARRCVRCIALSSHSSDAIRAADIEKERKRESALPLITHARVAALESPGAFTGNATMKAKKYIRNGGEQATYNVPIAAILCKECEMSGAERAPFFFDAQSCVLFAEHSQRHFVAVA